MITQKSFQFYQKAFPFCSQWKFTKDMYQCVEESAISGLIRWRPEFRNRVPDSIRWKYCLPNSALDKVFVKWRAEHCFSNVKPLEIFLRFSGIPEIVLDIPGENCPIGEKEKKYGVNSAQSPILTGNCFIESDHYLKLQKIC